jgi:hypothetical protein
MSTVQDVLHKFHEHFIPCASVNFDSARLDNMLFACEHFPIRGFASAIAQSCMSDFAYPIDLSMLTSTNVVLRSFAAQNVLSCRHK